MLPWSLPSAFSQRNSRYPPLRRRGPLPTEQTPSHHHTAFEFTTHVALSPVARSMKLPYAVARQYGRCARDVVERASRRRPLSSSSLTSSIDSNNSNNRNHHRNGREEEEEELQQSAAAAAAAAADAIGDGWMAGLKKSERKRLLRRSPVGSWAVAAAGVQEKQQLREKLGKGHSLSLSTSLPV